MRQHTKCSTSLQKRARKALRSCIRPTRYRRGYLAGRRGCTGADNPYESDSHDARAWITGLLDGRTTN